MPAVVTENWSDRLYQRGIRGRRGWVVTQVADEDAARAAVGSDAELGTAFPQDSRLKILTQPEVSNWKGPAAYHVVANFDRADNQPTPTDDDRLAKKPRYRWRSATVTEAADVDAQGIPLLNSAYAPFDQQPTRTFGTRFLTITVWHTDYDVALAAEYENSCNADEITLPRTGGKKVEPGQMLCHSIEPTHDYDGDTEFVQVAYTFELRRGNLKEVDGYWDPFKFRIPDRGYTGWYDDSGLKSGTFINSAKQRVAEPVLLDGTGKPIDTSFKIEGDKTPTSFQVDTPFVIEDTGYDAVMLKYYKFPFKPFTALGIWS